jgi:DNA-binding response OmpR family regulator
MMGARILIVEDDPEIGAALETYAAQKGFIVARADNGMRALEEAAKQQPDVVLLDISIPKIDGRDVLKRWRRDKALEQAVIIFVTARDEQSDRLLGLELGADDYETKPLRLSMLFRKIGHLLAKKRAGG